MSFLLTLGYSVLSHLSPGALFPDLGEYRIMLWLAVAAVLACLRPILLHRTLWRSVHVYLMIGLIAAIPISRIMQPGLGGTLQALREFMAASVVLFLIVGTVNTVGKLRVFAFVVVLSAVYLLSQSFYDVYTSGEGSRYMIQHRFDDSNGTVLGRFSRVRSVGFLKDPNDFAQYLLTAASLLTFAWKSGRGIRNVTCVVLPMGYLLYGVYATHSRGALIGIVVMAFLLVAKRFSRKTGLALAGGVFGLLIVAQAGGPRTTSLTEADATGRIRAWETGVELLRSSPVFGVGFHTFEAYNNNLTAHNSFVLCFAELGLFGYMFWLGLIVFSIADLNRILAYQNASAWAPEIVHGAGVVRMALLTFLATGWFLSRTYVVTLYVLIGMALVVRHIFQQRPEANTVTFPSRWALTIALAVGSILAVKATSWLANL